LSIDRYTVKWRQFLGGPSTDYLERAAQKYLCQVILGHKGVKDEALGKNNIEIEIDKATSFQTCFQCFEAEILQADGVGQKLTQANVMSCEVGGVIEWLEDLLCHAMLVCITFQAKYTSWQLLYQE